MGDRKVYGEGGRRSFAKLRMAVKIVQDGRGCDSVEAPPPDIASGGYELRAAFELWGLDAAALVAGPERPSAKYTIFAPGRMVHGVGL